MGYCTRADVYGLGLSPEAFARGARPIEDVVPATGTLFLRSHGLSADMPITLTVLSSSVFGAAPAVLPGGLVEGAAYAQPVNSDAFRVSTAPGGAPISSFTDAGEGVAGVIVDHGPYLDQAIEGASTIIDAHAVAHKAPLQASVLKIVCAFLAARIYIAAHAAGNPVFAKAAEPPEWLRQIIDRLFTMWLSGAPLPAGSSDATPQVAENAAALVRLDGRGFLDDCQENSV
jgi:hypothetical protein